MSRKIELVVYAQPIKDVRSPKSVMVNILSRIVDDGQTRLVLHYPPRLHQVNYQAEKLTSHANN